MKFYQTVGAIACILMVFVASGCQFVNYQKSTPNYQKVENVETTLNNTPEKKTALSDREALDIVKQYIDKGDTTVFEALTVENGNLTYYFKNTNYKIQHCDVYRENNTQYHLIQQYETVIDNEDTMEGHTATSNWYKVDDRTGKITPQFDENGNLVEEF